jgi:methionyl-tRNA synthetase
MASKDTYYLTTAIYYVNDLPHIGSCYEMIAADVLARWHRLAGDRVHFLTGTDEHGQKIARTAESRGLSPQDFVDEIVPRWTDTMALLQISYDDFIRTTQERHQLRVQEFMQRLYDGGDLYTATYSGSYCVSCEAYYTSEELLEGDLCPVHRRPVEHLEQENWFFRLSKYQDQLLRHYDEHPEFVAPASRLNEVRSFVEAGLEDISATRSAFDWGVDVPWENGHVFYVWFDALLNYITAIGYGVDDDAFNRRWPADVHIIGKDILRFHAVYWPAMLMAAGVPLPKQVFAHGFVLVGGEKMSKSNATQIHPSELIDQFGLDCYRYYFMREFSFGHDGTFSWESMQQRYTTDLANDLGNLVNRALNMVGSYCDGKVPEPTGETGPAEEALDADLQTAVAGYQAIDGLEFKKALEDLWVFVSGVNRYIEARAPWKLNKQGATDDLARCLYTAVDALRIITVLISPVMPVAAERLWAKLGLPSALAEQRFPDAAGWGGTPVGVSVDRGDLLFPKLEEQP